MKRIPTFLICTLVVAVGCDSNWKSKVVEDVIEAEQSRIDIETAEDIEKISDIYSDDYIGIDENGMKEGKQNYTATSVSENTVQPEISLSNLEVQPLRPQYALSMGIHAIKTMHYGAFPRVDSLRFTSVWKKCKGTWQLVSHQYTPIEATAKKMQASLEFKNSDLKKYCGSFVLSTDQPMEISIQQINENLELSIPQHMEEGRPLIIVSKDEFQTRDDDWEIEFISEDSIMLNTWGYEVGGRRL